MSTTTTTTTTQAKATSIHGPRPKDSMKSTWRRDPERKGWQLPHYLMQWLYVFHEDLDRPVPVHQKTDPMPYLTVWSCHAYILLHAAWPIALNHIINYYMGKPLHWFALFLLFDLSMQANAIHEIHILRRLGHKVGYLDGDKHARDGVPDQAVWKTFNSLELTTTVRPFIAAYLAYDTSVTQSLSFWLPVELFFYAIVLDGFFYAYHRSCHELDSLWQYHRTHHLTKHPSPLLSSYADPVQELIEIALVPLFTWLTLKYALGFPMGFHDWWVCHEYIIFSEAFGHSGLRVSSNSPGTATPFLELIGAELTIEDHDLHHRKGWKHSYNYGKQTRLWDKIFGTMAPRIENVPGNVDYVNYLNMPLL